MSGMTACSPGAVRQHGVDEGLAEVHSTARGLEHALDEVADLHLGEGGRGEFTTTAPR